VVVEVDTDTGKITVLDIAMCEDIGTLINPTICEGQVQGGYVQGIGGALLEELEYDEYGQLLNTDLTSYLHPLASDVPDVKVVHIQSPSPFTPLGTKGGAEGGTLMSCAVVVNAVEDALRSFDVKISDLPLTPERVKGLLNAAQAKRDASKTERERKTAPEYILECSKERTWRALNDPQVLSRCTPGFQSMNVVAPDHYEGVVKVGIGSISGTYKGEMKLSDKVDQEKYTIVGEGAGPIGTMNVTGNIELQELDALTTIIYSFEARIGGAVKGLAQRGLVPIAKYLIKQFFGSLAEELAAEKIENRSAHIPETST
jgi:carbon monoxide dehydrogenase subunit G